MDPLVNRVDFSNPTDYDYQSLIRKKTKLELILLSLVVFGIEICYAAETAFVSPILQKIGVPLQFMSMVWGLSPLVGFFTCPILGSLSDGCNSRLGRRRPFIIIYSFGILIGLLLVGYGDYLGNLFWTDSTKVNAFVIFFTILGVVLLDFDCDACQSPARAYLIDVSQTDDHSIGLSTFTVMAGAGGSLGYVLGGIPWAEINFSSTQSFLFDSNTTSSINETFSISPSYSSNLPNNQKKILFTSVAIIYVICTIISISSFKEIPLSEYRSKRSSSNYETNIKYEKMSEFEDENSINAHNNYSRRQSCTSSTNHLSCQQSKSETLKYYLKSIIKMPMSLRWLCVTHCFCWMSLLCFSLYFTDFVGEEIYGGDPLENVDLERHKMYNIGVRIGSFCMALYSISCSIYSFFLQFLITHFRTKNVYIFSHIVYSIGMLALGLTKSIVIAPITSLTAGIMYSSLFTIPFLLVANYHSTESFELLSSSNDYNEDSEEQTYKIKRGLGTDLSLVSSMVFVAQLILSFIIGPLMKLIGSKTVVVFASSFLSACAAISATRLLYLD